MIPTLMLAMQRCNRIGVFSALALAMLAAGCSRTDEAAERNERMTQAAQLQSELKFGDAARIYRDLLGNEADPPADAVRAELRYQLAQCLIHGDDLGGALEVLEELTEEDVRRFQMDIGPLYRELGDAWFAKGDKERAKLAWRLGRGVSPARVVEFNQRLDRLIASPDAKATDATETEKR